MLVMESIYSKSLRKLQLLSRVILDVCSFFSPFGRYYKGGVAVVAAPALFDLTVTKGSVLKYFSDNYELAYPASTQARDSDL